MQAARRSAAEADASGVLACLAVAASALAALGHAGAAATVASAVLVRAQRIRLKLEVISLDAAGALEALAAEGTEEDRSRGEAAGRGAALDELVALAG